MLSRNIFYCWFGKKPLPEIFFKCVESWKKFFPDYNIIKIDESNYDVNKSNFTRLNYKKGNMSLVADYARIDIIHEYGGLYFDIDVEVLKSFDDMPDCFMSFSADPVWCNNNDVSKYHFIVELGSGYRCFAGHPLLKESLYNFTLSTDKIYTDYIPKFGVKFVNEPYHTLQKNRVVFNNKRQILQGITFLPIDYLSPVLFDDDLGLNNLEKGITGNTHSIHHHICSWRTRIGNT